MNFEQKYLHERIGSMRQLAFVRRAVLEDGKGRNMRVVEISNGSGLRFTVYPDREWILEKQVSRGSRWRG